MGSNSKIEYREIATSERSTRALLLEQLQKASRKLLMTPFPFCEFDCPWLALCRKIEASECISTFLLETNTSNKAECEDNSIHHISWN